MKYKFTPIGRVHSCFTEKFGIPRQAGIVPASTGAIELFPPFDGEAGLRGLEVFSHIWIQFVFHMNTDRRWRPTVRPPRLGGNKRVGVFATRSPFRPNPIGLSAARLIRIGSEDGKKMLYVTGIDILDNSPVLDIKPYIPYADRLMDAGGGFAEHPPEQKFLVQFSAPAADACRKAERKGATGLGAIIEQMLSVDPRPAYYPGRKKKDTFGTKIHGLEIKWQVCGDTVTVMEIGF